MKVIFKHKNGRTQVMHVRYAKILRDLGHGEYEERENNLGAPAPQAPLTASADKLPSEPAFPGADDSRAASQVDTLFKAENAVLLNPSPTADEVKASKAAKALAESAGVDIRNVAGTGEAGSITKPDVQAFIDGQSQAKE
nr:E3 binding domain-containing protein [uncultured Pseudomonas sp.]